MIFVDAPRGGEFHKRYSRLGALMSAVEMSRDWLSAGKRVPVLLHDAYRVGERHSIEVALDMGFQHETLVGSERGLVALWPTGATSKVIESAADR